MHKETDIFQEAYTALVDRLARGDNWVRAYYRLVDKYGQDTMEKVGAHLHAEGTLKVENGRVMLWYKLDNADAPPPPRAA